MNPGGSPPSVATEVPPVSPAQVEEVLRALAAALRSYRLYEAGNPMLERFLAALKTKLAALWDHLPTLRLEIEEHRICWQDHTVFPTGDTPSDLPFLFYKDGIRELSFQPGIEDEEIMALLRVLSRAPAVREEEDDLITLLWQEDLSKLRYRVVEALAEGAETGRREGGQPPSVDPATVRAAASTPAAGGISTDDFQETLYFLDDAELRRLREEVRQENERDLWKDVLNALLDRIEDGSEERQQRIVTILCELLPSALATASFDRAAALLEEMVEMATRPGVLAPAAVRRVRGLFEILGSDSTIAQLGEILEEMPDRLSDPAVVRLLGYFPPRSIGFLMRAAERIDRPDVRRAFESCIQRLAEANRGEVVALLESEDAAVLAGALRWIGRLEIGSALNEVVAFLNDPDAEVRLAAIETIVALRAGAAGAGLLPLLDDPHREVRIAAARALGVLAYGPGRAPLEAAIGSKRLREADRNEKVAFFEAFGRLAGPEAVPMLDRMLNSRSWLGRGEPAEIRACAAVALSRIRHPSARTALSNASADSDAVVRTAVARALKGES